jgi:mono/diheme cytochrome c family protein
MDGQAIGKGVAILGMLLSFWSPVLVSALSAADETDKYASQGRALYVQLCVACHGPSGRGDGPAAEALKTPPADLTQISRRYSGFPTDKIMTWIDGEKASVAHGTREMPIWGRTFRRQRGEAEALGEVYALTRYLQSIQQK